MQKAGDEGQVEIGRVYNLLEDLGLSGAETWQSGINSL